VEEAPSLRRRELALLTLVVLACGALSRWIAFPTASMLAVAIGGLGFAAVLVHGWRAGILVALTAWGGAAFGATPVEAATAGIAVGACALQWWLGALLLRWRGSAALTLAGPLDVLQFALSASAASLPAAIITLIGQAQLPGDPIEWFDLLACWVTLSAGLCCVAPVVLALIGQPRSAWRSRGINTALPLVVAVGLFSWKRLHRQPLAAARCGAARDDGPAPTARGRTAPRPARPRAGSVERSCAGCRPRSSS